VLLRVGDREHGLEPQVRGERDEKRPQCPPRPEEREADQERGERDRQRQAPAVVPLDPFVQRLQRLEWIAGADDSQAAGRDVLRGDEPVDPRRVGRQQPGGAQQSDRRAGAVRRQEPDRRPTAVLGRVGRPDDARLRSGRRCGEQDQEHDGEAHRGILPSARIGA
jgi:hypothetical protein